MKTLFNVFSFLNPKVIFKKTMSIDGTKLLTNITHIRQPNGSTLILVKNTNENQVNNLLL